MELATSVGSLVSISVHNREGQAARDRAELREALLRQPREIPSRFFYDDRGSHLFERITELPEYYQTRTERALLVDAADRIAALTAASQLVEIGSGAATKTRVLLDALDRAGTLRLYVPVDVAAATVRRVAYELADEYPGLMVDGLVADFNANLAPLPALPAAGGSAPQPRLVIFLGGTIGNLKPDEAQRFLATRHHEMSAGDFFLLGVDLVKPTARLEAAYNDAAGVTAEFNRNILRVANQVAEGGTFEPMAFEHLAVYDPATRWIEMRLRSTQPQHVRLPALGLDLDLAAGEEIRTEISAKYDRPAAQALLAAAGFDLVHWFEDHEALFGLALAVRR